MALRLSTRARYGLRALTSLARHYNEGPIMARLIANEEDISENYLEQIMEPLKKAGLVRSIRGSQGGFILARNPKDIKIKEAIDILEGPINLIDCLIDPSICKRSDTCLTRKLWETIRENIIKVTETKTLADLIENKEK
ncbi:MAG: RrF2 family transcriptional regulator [bacterium]